MEQLITAAAATPVAKNTAVYTGKIHTPGGRDHGIVISSGGEIEYRFARSEHLSGHFIAVQLSGLLHVFEIFRNKII